MGSVVPFAFRDNEARMRATRERVRRLDRPRPFALEAMEPRVLLSGVPIAAGAEAAIVDGLNRLANVANAIESLDQLASSLPVVDQAIAPVLQFEKKIKDTLLTPVQSWFTANNGDSGTLVAYLNSLPGFSGGFTDLSSGSDVKIGVNLFNTAQKSTQEDVSIDLGGVAEQLGLNFGNTKLDFTTAFKLNGGTFSFGFDTTAGLAPADAFFIDFGGSTLNFNVDTPFANHNPGDTLNFNVDLGTLGNISVTNGSINLDADVNLTFLPGRISASDLVSKTLAQLAPSITATASLTATLPISATLAGQSVGSGTISASLTGDAFNGFSINVSVDNQSFKNFSDITPGDIVSALTELGTNLQALAGSFDLPDGVPFVKDKISDVLDFAGRLQDLTKQLFDLGLQGGTEFLASALTGAATFKVVVDGVTSGLITVNAGTLLSGLVAAVQPQLPAGLEAIIDNGRLAIRATGDTIQTLKFSNVNSFAQAALGLADTQSAIPFYDFVTFQQLQALIDAYLPGPFSITYDPAAKSIGLDLSLFGSVQRAWNLDFSDEIGLGGLATLELSGTGSADVAAAARLNLAAAFDLLPMTSATLLKDLNGGKGIRTNGTGVTDLNFITADNSPSGVNLDALTLATATVGELIAQVSLQTGGKVTASINFTQDGLIFTDTTTGGTKFTVAAGSGSAAIVDLGFGIGQSDGDLDKKLAGGSIISRLYLKPYNAGSGSYIAIGVSADVQDLHLGAALGVLELGVSGETTTPLSIAALGKLKDPNSSGKLYLPELLAADIPNTIDVGFGKFVNSDLTGTFTNIAAGNTIGKFELTLDIDELETYGINLGGEVPKVTITVSVDSVASFIPKLDFDAAVTGSLPNFEDVLSSFKNLSIEQILGLVGKIVKQFGDLPILSTQLPLLDKSLGDLTSLITDKVDTLFAEFKTLQADLTTVIGNVIDALQTKADTIILGGQHLADGLVAIGQARQDALFHALEHLQGAIQAIPADFDIIIDGGSSKLLNLAGAFRALKEVVADIEANVPGAAKQAVVDFFNKKVPGTAFAVKPIFATILGFLPSSDRIVQMVMEALGLNLKDLFTDAAAATILAALDAAKGVAQAAITAITPPLPTGDLGFGNAANTARNDAQAALNSAKAELQKTVTGLDDAVTNINVFAAMRALTSIEKAISDVRLALTKLVAIPNGNAGIDAAKTSVASTLTNIIDNVRAKMFQAFPLGGITFDMPDGNAIEVNLHFSRSITAPVNVKFDLAAESGLPPGIPVNFEAAAAGDVTIGADFTAGFGIDLDSAGGHFLAPFISSLSKIELTADVMLDLAAKATIGGFTLEVQGGKLMLRDSIDLGAGGVYGGGDDNYGGPARLALTLNDTSPADGRIYFTELGLSSFVPTLAAHLLVDLPIFVNGNPLGGSLPAKAIHVEATLTDFAGFEFNIGGLPPELITEILNGLTELNLKNILAGFETLWGAVSGALQSDLLSKLPLVGNSLDEVGAKMDEIKAKFYDPIKSYLDGLAAGATPQAVLDALKQKIFDSLGPAGLNVLQGVVTVADVPLTWTGQAIDLTSTTGLLKVDAGFQFDLKFGFDKWFHIPLDFGFDGMGLVGLESNASLNLRFAPVIELVFGLTRTKGFYIDVLNTVSDPAYTHAGATAELSLPDGSSLTGKLFFLQLEAAAAPTEDMNGDGDATDLGLSEVADHRDYNHDGDTLDTGLNEAGDANGDGKITQGVAVFATATFGFQDKTDATNEKLRLTDFGNFKPTFTAVVDANIDIEFTASLGGQQALPSLKALLDISWDFNFSDGVASTAIPLVEFGNIRLDLGDFFRDNIAPVIDLFDDFFAPLKAIRDVVETEIPVISDLSKLLGGDPITFLDLVGLLGSGLPELKDFFGTLDQIVKVVDTLTTIGNAIDGLADGFISFGDLDLSTTGIDVTKSSSKSAIKSLTESDLGSGFDAAGVLSSIMGQLGSAGNSLNTLKDGSFSSGSTGVNSGKFFLPIIDDPFGTVSGFLLGQTKDLVVWDLPDFVAKFQFKQLFGPILPPIPLFVSIFGSFQFSTDFAIGFDTRGIQQSAADFYKGFYLRDWKDTNGNGILDPGETTEARELGLDLEFGAGAELNVVVASAGVEGGIHAAITADWHDVLEDGKFYIDELASRLSQGIECIFELSGQLTAFLRAFVKIGFDTPFGFVTLFEDSLDLLNVTLLDFSASCPPLPIPQPGRWTSGSHTGEITLNIGPEASHRQPGATDVAETVEVFGERDTDGTATVISFPTATIVDSDGDGDIDSDDVAAWINADPSHHLSPTIDLNGDDKIDTDEARLIEDFNGNGSIGSNTADKQSVMLIGFGQWQLFLNNATSIKGDGGKEDDQILFDHSVWIPGLALRGGSGKDKITGGMGNDSIFGDPGEDILIGDFGNDTISGGSEDDQIYGNAGNDNLSGDAGNDTIYGDNGDGKVPAVLDLQGKPVGSSTVALDQLKDTIHGGDGEDNLFGEWGDDTMYGEVGPDQLSGGQGNDFMSGGADIDLLEGNEGSDSIYGDAGNDILFGEADGISTTNDGNDYLNGGDDNDTIRDDYGNDKLVGGFGDDFMVAGLGDDVLFGDQDPTVGGAAPAGTYGKDTIYGDRDILPASPAAPSPLSFGDGKDYIEGGANADTIYGGAGDDRIIGGSSPFAGTTFGGSEGADFIYGEAGDDIIAGDNAAIGTAGDVTSLKTVTTYAAGGAGIDRVRGGAGKDWIFGGGSDDFLYGDEAGDVFDDIVVGDQGTLSATHIIALHSATAGSGGNDLIYGYGGNDILLGGDGADTVAGNLGDDVMLGDNGDVSLSSGVVIRVATTEPDQGGDDFIYGDAGADLAFGGKGDDYIYGGGSLAASGDLADVLFGDHGVAILVGGTTAGDTALGYNENDLYSSDPDQGGKDSVFGGFGDDFIFGGSGGTDLTPAGGDSLLGQTGNDVVFGDNGVVRRTSGASPVVQEIQSISSNKGGDDFLSGDVGVDVLVGGYGKDTVTGGDGDDVMLGDNGELLFDVDADLTKLDVVRTTFASDGHADLLSGDKGADVGMGGTDGDTIYGDNSTASNGAADLNDILLGDNGEITLLTGPGAITVLGGTVKTIRTTDTVAGTGGKDTVSGNAGADIILGGVQGDNLYGDAATPGANDGDDVMLGDNGRLEWGYGGNGSPIEAGFAFDATLTTLDLITTELPALHPGGRDLMFGDNGKDVMFGGEDADLMYGDDGLPANLPEGSGPATNNDLMFGDHGRLYPQFSQANLSGVNSKNFFSIDTGAGDAGQGDQLFGEEGNDILLGGQGDDRMFGGSGDDDMIGGHNVAGGVDELAAGVINAIGSNLNDLMDGGTGNDAMAGDNATIWRLNNDSSPRFRTLNGATTLYSSDESTITTNVGSVAQSDPDDVVGRDITLLDHSASITQASGLFGNDVMAGGAGRDTMFGELGDDRMQGDGSIDGSFAASPALPTLASSVIQVTDSLPLPDAYYLFNVREQATDADDYMEGNGGTDLMFGGLGQDDIIGGSSDLFGLDTATKRPDGSDTIFGGADTVADTARNTVGDATTDAGGNVVYTAVPNGHSLDADFIMGDNADVFRIVTGLADDLFRTFNYDSSPAGSKIVPRSMKQLDYTLGGADYAGGSYVNGVANADNGAADIIHGEAGDDVIFGMTGSDVMFGEGQDDDIVGGYGNDWISGGTGQDGVIGDDGLISTSRNGTAEPLYALAATTQQTISTPGGIQIAIINPTGQLKKVVDLVPFSYDHNWIANDDEFPDAGAKFADDIIFGGLGSDFLHGGSGDDAISGAEALDHAYVPKYTAGVPGGPLVDLGYAAMKALVVTPPSNLPEGAANPGGALSFYDEDTDGLHLNNRFRAGEFDLYDEFNALRKVMLNADGSLNDGTGVSFNFLLNFAETEGVIRPAGTVPKSTGQQATDYPQVNDDGADAIFGDNGNDWIVGGTGRDDMYGGWGNDLLNADDNQNTHGGLNDQPDTQPYFEDRAYGGAGRDVLIGNTGGDRLIDWVGEYNSYIVPYAPFGEASVSRTMQPQLKEYLYALSKADGADPTRGGDVTRNGEPGGELGLVKQQDFAWGDQTGAPADPQAGNIPGGPRDVLRTAGFNDGTPQGFFVDVGKFDVKNGRLSVSSSVAGGDAVAVFYVDSFVPNYFEIQATINAAKPTGGSNSNAYLIFDYQSPTSFKYAGINVSTNKLEIGERTASGWTVRTQGSVPGSVKSATDYNLFVAINGTAVTLIVNNQVTLNYVFAPRVTADGVSHGISEGMVGLGAQNSSAEIDNVSVQRVPPAITFTKTEDFTASPTLFNESSAGWALATGRFAGTANGTTPAIELAALNVGSAYLLDLSGTFKTAGEGGLVFDLYSPTDYKFVTVSLGKITLGHRTGSGFVTDAVYSNSNIVLNADETIGLTLKGTTVSVTRKVGTANSTVLSFIYNGVVTDGGAGLFSRTGATSFDSVTVKSDDPRLSVLSASGVQSASVTKASVQQNSVVDWNGSSTDLMAALGWNGAGNAQKPAFPEFSFVGFVDSQNAKSTELEPAEETAWYVEV